MQVIKLQQFEGPLDLLLQLIEQKQLDISQVSLSTVTEQYMGYLRKVQEVNPEELADFLVVAAKLLLIKSRLLIPSLEVEEEETDLEQQLRIYREFYEASKILHKMILQRRFLFPRERPAIAIEPVFNPPATLTRDRLRELFLDVLQDIEPVVALPKQLTLRTISIQEKIEHLRQHISSQVAINFRTILSSSKDKTEVIVTFLALLELVKQRFVAVVQKNTFSDIEIRRLSQSSDHSSSPV